ncbi:MAG TPA: hypothetical protein VLX91_10185 [Candidatus Acidoferrales bacterium]|nr:hypothetical protein [Candidatus Acidoferrales bacterium]
MKKTSLEPILEYSITTEPFPLKVDASEAELEIVATNNSEDDVTLRGIRVKIPVGNESTQLTNDSRSIVPISPEGWRSVEPPRYAAGSVEFTFRPNSESTKLPKHKSLSFTFNDVRVNTEPGIVEIDITEGTDDCTPGMDCPVETLSLAKFPHAWGEVKFTAKPVNVPYDGGTVLRWDGPQDGTYSIEYIDWGHDGENVIIPKQGGPPFGNSGRYPAQGAPELRLRRRTTFTLNVEANIRRMPFSAQKQVTVDVKMPRPVIDLFAAEPSIVNMSNVPPINLKWKTSNASMISIDGQGDFEDAKAENGSIMVTPGRTRQYFATAYGLEGYAGRPAKANTWVKFIGTASSGYLPTFWPPRSDPWWIIEILTGRKVFALYTTMRLDSERQEVWVEAFLSIVPGVRVANLGYTREAASYDQVLNAEYGTDVPMSHILSGFNNGYDVWDQKPDNVGATWGVKFNDGLLGIIWFHGVNQQDSNISYTFKWILFDKSLMQNKKK